MFFCVGRDYHTHQSNQNLAGFGWQPNPNNGIEDWGFQHATQGVICERFGVTLLHSNQHCNGGALSDGALGNKVNVKICGEECFSKFGDQVKFLTFRKTNQNNENGECFCESTQDGKIL